MPRHPTTRRPPVKRRGAPVVERVLDLTLDELSQRGFHALSVLDIAERADVNKTSIYRRWPTKGALVAAALERALGHEDDLPDTGSLRSDLVHFTSRALTWSGSPLGRNVMRMLLADAGDPDLMAMTETLLRRRSGAPRILFRRARERGEISAQADVTLAMTVVAGTLLQRTLVENAKVPRSFIERLVTFVLAGLTTPDPATSASRGATRSAARR